MPHAWEVSVAETIAMLEGPFKSMADAIARDEYGLWLGSGISMKRMPKLQFVAEKVLRYIHGKCVAADPNCRFCACLTDLLNVASLSDGEWGKVDFTAPIDVWLDVQAISVRLVNHYASMLDQPPVGEDEDFLLWNAIDIVSTYADPTKLPDVEHLSVAALVMEGALSDIASANWDGLLEKAVKEFSGTEDMLNVIVLPEDIRKSLRRPKLYKFHGCAVLAAQDEPKYRSRLVGRKSQIDGWIDKAENTVIGAKLIDMVTTKPTLMLGLSAQDSNIQGIFVKAQQMMSWPWPNDPPAYVFSEDKIGPNHQGLLKNVYKDKLTPANSPEVQESALLRSFAKALLPALWLHVLGTKTSAMVSIGGATLDIGDQTRLREGISKLRDMAATLAVVDHEEDFARSTAKAVGRSLSLFRNGIEPATGDPLYIPLSQTPVQGMLTDPLISTSGLGEASIALGIIGIGTAELDWKITSGEGARPGCIKISSDTASSDIFFAANTASALQMKGNGSVQQTDNAIIVHSHPMIEKLPRSPRSEPVRKGKPSLREVSIQDLIAEGGDLSGLLNRFREKVSL